MVTVEVPDAWEREQVAFALSLLGEVRTEGKKVLVALPSCPEGKVARLREAARQQRRMR